MKPCIIWTLLSISLLLSGVQATAQDVTTTVRGSGHVNQTTRQVAGIRGVVLELPADLTILQGTTEGVSIETDDNMAPWIDTVVSAGQLVLRARRGASLQPSTLKMVVNIRQIDSVTASGSGSIRADGLASTGLTLQISGSGDMHLTRVRSNTLNLSISGSGNFWASGQVDTVYASISGSGHLHMKSLEAKNIKLDIAGAGDATLWASQTLAVTAGGTCQVRYYGDARVTQSITGTGSVTRLGPSPDPGP